MEIRTEKSFCYTSNKRVQIALSKMQQKDLNQGAGLKTMLKLTLKNFFYYCTGLTRRYNKTQFEFARSMKEVRPTCEVGTCICWSEEEGRTNVIPIIVNW